MERRIKVVTIIGARPQFIKASVVSKEIAMRPTINEVIVHTGQHYDHRMSGLFFGELGLPQPSYQLNINGGTHGDMTGRMLIAIEEILIGEKPDYVLVYGDTNSTLAGALAAAKLHIPIAHVEAGLRSFNMAMPEEINRILTDQVSQLLFCPTQLAVDNLEKEGFRYKTCQIHLVGDVMFDSAKLFADYAKAPDLNDTQLPEGFILATIHRAENTDNISRLAKIVEALNTVHRTVAPVVMPLHPRTKAVIEKSGLTLDVKTIQPVSYLEMLWLLQHCQLVMTDSGGLQKEAYFFEKYCLTVREQTEWNELIQSEANLLVGSDIETIIASANKLYSKKVFARNIYGNSSACAHVVNTLAGL